MKLINQLNGRKLYRECFAEVVRAKHLNLFQRLYLSWVFICVCFRVRSFRYLDEAWMILYFW